MRQDDITGLTKLGSAGTEYLFEKPASGILEVFPNKFPRNNYKVQLVSEEFTSLCPKTGQPDFATIRIDYKPGEWCVETKSLKLYLFAYRNQGTFMETITNQILMDLMSVLYPLEIWVEGRFKSRGGIELTVEAVWKST
jgi:7-cyano-7-deazaguanine reductase